LVGLFSRTPKDPQAKENIQKFKEIKNTIKVLKNQKLRNKVMLEASGGINSTNISKYGQTGVDIISVGSITNSVKGIDMSLEI